MSAAEVGLEKNLRHPLVMWLVLAYYSPPRCEHGPLRETAGREAGRFLSGCEIIC
ncbi:protein of unknown function [Paraburkholderia kururiensis]